MDENKSVLERLDEPEHETAPEHGDVTYGADAPEPPPSAIPEVIREAAKDDPPEAGIVEADAMDWLMASEEPTAEEVQAVELKINVANPMDPPKLLSWHVVPLPDEEFRKFRRLAQPRNVRRGGLPNLTEMDDGRYHLLVVTAATVSPDLREAARRKGINDPAEVLKHRFRHKPGLIAQISGMISDVSGFNETDVTLAEKATGNS